MKTPVLCENRDFIRLYRKGKSQVHPVLVTYLLKNRVGETRMGITATKKVGCAVERNRGKRVIRAAFRDLAPEVPSGYDLVFVCRGRTPHCKMQQVRSVMKQQLDRLLPKKTEPKPQTPPEAPEQQN